MLHFSLVGQYRTLLAIVLKRATKKMRLAGFAGSISDERDKCLSQIIFLQKEQENDL
jgi:hypothetical protein